VILEYKNVIVAEYQTKRISKKSERGALDKDIILVKAI